MGQLPSTLPTRSLGSDALIVALFAGLGAVAALAFNVLLGATYGLSQATDAFFIATQVPAAAMAILNGCSMGLVPVVVAVHDARGRGELARVMGSLFWMTVGTLGGLNLVIWVLAPWMVALLGPGLAPDAAAQTTTLLRLVSLSLIFIAAGQVASGPLYAFRRYAVAASDNLLIYGTGAVAAFFLSKSYGPAGFALGLVCGFATWSLVFVLVALLGTPLWLPLTCTPADPDVHLAMRLTGASVVGLSVRQLAPIVERALASTLSPGSVAIVGYAYRITMGIGQLTLSSVTRVTLPRLSSDLTQGNNPGVGNTLRKSARLMSVVSIGAVVLIISLGPSLPALLLMRGAFSTTDVMAMTPTLALYAPSLIALGHLRLAHAYFYARRSSRAVVLLMLMVTFATVLLDFVLLIPLGTPGLGLGLTLGSLVVVLGAYVWLCQHEAHVRLGDLLPLDLRLWATGLGMGLATALGSALVERLWPTPGLAERVSTVVGGVLAGIVAALALGAVLGLPEVRAVWSVAIRRSKTRRDSRR